MNLLITLLPIYVFGNLHCFGMCGPLVLMLGQHRHRYYYFLGRTLAFSLAGLAAGGLGAVLHVFLTEFHIPALASFLFGGLILTIGVHSLTRKGYPGMQWIGKHLKKINHALSLLILRDQPWPVFLFGFFTIVLPCGQTVIVYSACALEGNATVGLLNGMVFALLTSPSLLLAMHAHGLFARLKHHYNVLMGASAIIVGGLALCRGFAEMGMIPHLILNSKYHIVLF